ncbi:MAG: asparagine synthase (glutamine-hydrolyzing), partial [Gammaproteobacteria bacterium]|nr:asparagine synthase (glutamine-hydrolyzing) [Gammaproteobacteria bacterium]
GIALWDAGRRRLVLARDRIGEKPLYYARDGARLLFGSEIKAILPGLRRRHCNPQAVCDFLAAGYVAGDHTFYSEISRLPPGHLLVWENGRVTVSEYWRFSPQQKCDIAYDAAASRLEDEMRNAVRLCLKSDVEVGAFLSGGLDSSLIVALIREQEAHVQTFSVGYRGEAEGFNELSYARQVARHLGTEHHELILDAHSSMELLPRIIGHYDEPHGEPTSVLVYLLCEFTRRQLKVAVGGTGGDELFYGYPRHAGARYLDYYRMLPRVVRKHVVERIIDTWGESTRGSRLAKRARRFISGASFPPAQAYLSWINLFHPSVRERLVSSSVRDAATHPAGDEFLRARLYQGDGNLFDRITRLDVEGYLAEYQLAYMDRMSMAHSLEVRSPFCDYRLVEFAASLPTAYRLKGTRSKHILKHVARRWLPKSIVERRKVGFDSPIGQWLKGELRGFLTDFLAPAQLQRSGLLDADAVQAVVQDHLEGRRDYSLQLWSLIALEAWHRMYIEDQVVDARDYPISSLRGAMSVAGDTVPRRRVAP